MIRKQSVPEKVVINYRWSFTTEVVHGRFHCRSFEKVFIIEKALHGLKDKVEVVYSVLERVLLFCICQVEERPAKAAPLRLLPPPLPLVCMLLFLMHVSFYHFKYISCF